MPRAVQSASLSFGLVNIPVKLYSAAHSKSVSFHLLHAKDGSRIREQVVCQSEDKPVDRDELVKGFEVSKGKYVEITNDEIDDCPRGGGQPECRDSRIRARQCGGWLAFGKDVTIKTFSHDKYGRTIGDVILIS